MNNKVIWLLVAIAVVAVGVLLLTSGGGPEQPTSDTQQEQSIGQGQDQQGADSAPQDESQDQAEDESTAGESASDQEAASDDQQASDESDEAASDEAASDETADDEDQDGSESGASDADEGEQLTETTEPGDEQVADEESSPTQEPASSETPTTESTSPAAKGQVVEQVTIIEESDPAKAVDRIKAGELQVFADGTSDPSVKETVERSEDLASYTSYGSYQELTLNPYGPTFENGDFNPFSNKRVREAMNWLVDREYLASEVYGGLAVPRYLPLTTAFPDYARLVDVARQLEIKYSHNPEKAERIIAEEMQSMGAELVDGTWQYEGEPIELKLLIRVEDERREVGDYVANQLEELGFKTQRMYKTSKEASPIWIGGDPAKGEWHVYTGGWITNVVSRDQAGNFDFFYTPRGLSQPLWQKYQPSEAFDQTSDRLARRDYDTMAERNQLMADALRMAMENSARIWLVDTISVWPRSESVSLAADLAGGISGSYLWPHTLRAQGRKTVTFASPSILTGPWNAIEGSNWVFDSMIIRATGELPYMPDPYTGLYRPQRVTRAEVTVKEGLPIQKSLDWIELNTQPEIQVPEDAWIDWNAEANEVITVGEKHPDGLTAKTKTVVHYDPNFIGMEWHDGSKLSIADLVMGYIMTYERGKESSQLYDAGYEPDFKQFQKYYKGLRVVQTDPLVVEIYSDLTYLDAETIAAEAADDFFPYYSFGPAPWHALVPGILAERSGELAFSADKADKMGVDQISYVGGPSLDILKSNLQRAIDEALIPFESTLGEYVTSEEAQARYENLMQWHTERGHFWVGQGPYYLKDVSLVEGVVTLERHDAFPDDPDKWMRFSEPRIADVSISGPERVASGESADMTVNVSFEGQPYAAEDVSFVKYLVFDAEGELLFQGEAEAAADGKWTVNLTAEETEQLATGTNRLEVAVVPTVVSKPSFAQYTFVSIAP